MNTWIPLWTSTVDSTLWEEPPHVRVMFLTMLMIRDPDHVVRQPFRRVCKKANLSEDQEEAVKLAQEALKILKEPDARSIDDQEFGGRRIREVEDGWLILNGAKYDEEMRALTARMRKTRLQRERREKERIKPGKPLPGEVAAVKAEGNGDLKEAQRIAEAALPSSGGVSGPPGSAFRAPSVPEPEGLFEPGEQVGLPEEPGYES